MDEALPLLIGSVVFIFALKFLFTQNDNDNNNNNQQQQPNGTIREGEEGEVLLENLAMAFPNIPLPVIRDQLSRRLGDVDATSEVLLSISHRYPAAYHPIVLSSSTSSTSFAKMEDDVVSHIELDKQKWEKDKKFRGDFLKNRKLQMLKDAQKYSFT